MKNPGNKPLKIVRPHFTDPNDDIYIETLGRLAIAESNLVKAGKDSAMPHFLAIVKELEDYFGFKFEIIEEEQ